MSAKVRSRHRLWFWIKTNCVIDISLQVAVGAEDIRDRLVLINGVYDTLRRALPAKRFNIEIAEVYRNGSAWWINGSKARDVPQHLQAMDITSRLISCAVGHTRVDASPKTKAAYRAWRDNIITELRAMFGPGFVARCVEETSAVKCLSPDWSVLPATPTDGGSVSPVGCVAARVNVQSEPFLV